MPLANCLDEANERVREELTRHFEALAYFNPREAADAAMSLDGMRDRLTYVASRVPPGIFSRDAVVLVSGMGVGGEMLAARERGAGFVHGVEVDPLYVELCRLRLKGLEGLFPRLYDGERLPYEPAFFDLVLSGHIIEHTKDPRAYLSELLRVLRPGGWLFLEFPNRFHVRELHTGLFSVEWLPRPLRNGALRLAASRFSPLSPSARQKCRTIVATGLKQISIGRVKRWLAEEPREAALLDLFRPAPGIVRCLVRRLGTG